MRRLHELDRLIKEKSAVGSLRRIIGDNSPTVSGILDTYEARIDRELRVLALMMRLGETPPFSFGSL